MIFVSGIDERPSRRTARSRRALGVRRSTVFRGLEESQRLLTQMLARGSLLSRKNIAYAGDAAPLA